jgi:hypothetical protein
MHRPLLNAYDCLSCCHNAVNACYCTTTAAIAKVHNLLLASSNHYQTVPNSKNCCDESGCLYVLNETPWG